MICLLLCAIAFGPTYSIPVDDRVKAEAGLRVSVGRSLKVWADYSKPDFQLRGQNMGGVEVVSAGLQYEYDWDRVFVFAELGYGWTSESTIEIIRTEAVVADLEHDHGQISFSPQHSRFSIGNGYTLRVGGGIDITKHIRISAALHAFRPNMSMDVWRGSPDSPCFGNTEGGCWQNRKTYDGNALQLRLEWRL